MDREGGVNGVLVLSEGVRFASVGFDGSLGSQGVELSSDLSSDLELLISVQNRVAPAGLIGHRRLPHHHVCFAVTFQFLLSNQA